MLEPLSEPERSGGSANGAPASEGGASPAVPPRPKRRTFSAAYKARIVEEADACTEPGEIGALLRREGLYSSHLVDWRRQYRGGALRALSERRRGPAVEGLSAREKARYERKIAGLEDRLRQAELIIEVQKKVSQLLGRSSPDPAGESE
jgi:transposase